MSRDRRCRCGHPESVHTKTTGPNSIGRSWAHGCAEGWSSVLGIYLVQGRDACRCVEFAKRRWWQR